MVRNEIAWLLRQRMRQSRLGYNPEPLTAHR
jgi:hypothetical protein